MTSITYMCDLKGICMISTRRHQHLVPHTNTLGNLWKSPKHLWDVLVMLRTVGTSSKLNWKSSDFSSDSGIMDTKIMCIWLWKSWQVLNIFSLYYFIVFPVKVSGGSLPLCHFIKYAYIRRYLKETVLWSIITWPTLGNYKLYKRKIEI